MEKMHYSDKNLSLFQMDIILWKKWCGIYSGEKCGSKGWTVCMAAISMMLNVVQSVIIYILQAGPI